MFPPENPAASLEFRIEHLFAYAKSANSGMQNLLNIGANLLLQHLTDDPEAEIIQNAGIIPIKPPNMEKQYNAFIPSVFG